MKRGMTNFRKNPPFLIFERKKNHLNKQKKLARNPLLKLIN